MDAYCFLLEIKESNCIVSNKRTEISWEENGLDPLLRFEPEDPAGAGKHD
jgi:hypothetical protein